MTRIRLSTLVAAAALAAACGEEPTRSGTDFTEQESFDVAAVVGDAVAEDVSLLRMHEGAFGVPSLDALFTGEWKNNCTYSAATGWFACPVLTHDGRTVTRSYQLLDANGQPQAAYDATTTASANFVTTMSGSVTREDFSATFTRQRSIAVSGLAGAETQHVVNGTGSSSVTQSRHTDGGTRNYSMSSADVFGSIVIPFPRVQGSWPLSGTITRQVTFSRTAAGGQRTGSRTVTVTFNGTQFVPLVVGDRTFTLDLATGRISRPAGAS